MVDSLHFPPQDGISQPVTPTVDTVQTSTPTAPVTVPVTVSSSSPSEPSSSTQSSNTTSPAPEKSYIDQLVSEDILGLMGYKDLTDDQKKDHYVRMLDTIQNRLAARVADALGPEDAQKWEEMAKTDEKGAIAFLEEKGINIDEWMMEETLHYKDEMVKAAKEITGANSQ